MLTFQETELPGVMVVETEATSDERGWFGRTYCFEEFAEQGIDFAPMQISRSSSRRRGTLRGLHFQAPPQEEAKLVVCTRGSVFDVAVDVRDESPTYGQWMAAELSGENRRSLYIPPGCAHGVQTLADDTELLYLISQRYEPGLQRGIRWDDPAVGIDWPNVAERVISPRDRQLPMLEDASAG